MWIIFTSPYDLELVDYVDKYVPAYKIGSRDITYLEIVNKIAIKKAGDFSYRSFNIKRRG